MSLIYRYYTKLKLCIGHKSSSKISKGNNAEIELFPGIFQIFLRNVYPIISYQRKIET